MTDDAQAAANAVAKLQADDSRVSTLHRGGVSGYQVHQPVTAEGALASLQAVADRALRHTFHR